MLNYQVKIQKYMVVMIYS